MAELTLDVVIPLSSGLDKARVAALHEVIRRVKAIQLTKLIFGECSTTGSFREDLPADAHHVKIQGAWNKPVAVNQAVMSCSTSEWIMVLDADVLIHFPAALEMLKKVPDKVQAIRPFSHILRLDPASTELMLQGGEAAKVKKNWESVSVMCGGVFLIRRELFLRLRGFDERFDNYLEDVDLKMRISKVTSPTVWSNLVGYHLYHPPILRKKESYRLLYQKRRDLSLQQVTADTVSCIPLDSTSAQKELKRTTFKERQEAQRLRMEDQRRQILLRRQERLRKKGKMVPVKSPRIPAPPPVHTTAVKKGQAPVGKTRGRPQISAPFVKTAGTAVPSVVFATLLPDGGEYSDQRLWALYQQIGFKATGSWRFLCIASRPDSVPGGIGPSLFSKCSIEWSPLELFKTGVVRPGETCVYIPLDSMLGELSLPEATATDGLWLDLAGSARRPFVFRGMQPGMVGMLQKVQHLSREHANCAELLQWHPTLNARIGLLRDVMLVGTSDEASEVFKANALVVWHEGHPWTHPRPDSPRQASKQEIVDNLWLIACWFGSDGERLAAAREGARMLCTRPNHLPHLLLVEAVTGESQIPEWTGNRLVLQIDEGNKDIWQKERMLQIGIQYAMQHLVTDKTVGFFLPDLDVYPDVGSEDMMWKLALGLKEHMLCQPWKTVRESNNSSSFNSFGFCRKHGAKKTGTGPGFAVAFSTSFVKVGGKFIDDCVTGGGDSVAMEAWCPPGELNPTITCIIDMCRACRSYKGPRPGCAFVPGGNLVHHYHGERFGPNNNRKYVLRHSVWNWCGGAHAVLEVDPRNSLWRWRDTPIAQAVRAVKAYIYKHNSIEGMYSTWKKEVKDRGLDTRFITKEDFDRLSVADPAYYVQEKWTYMAETIKQLQQLTPDQRVGGLLEVGPYKFSISPDALCMDVKDWGIGALIHDAAASPWPIRRLFSSCVALQSIEHFGFGGQEAFFRQAANCVLHRVIVSVPWKQRTGDPVHDGIDEAKVRSWTKGCNPDKIIVRGTRAVLVFQADKLRHAFGIPLNDYENALACPS